MKDSSKKIPATVEQKENGVEITFDDKIPREFIESQVQECQDGT
ncbi:MAG: hypothetical protein ABFS19_08105 [Thermodesulfobacteriota bacterium]